MKQTVNPKIFRQIISKDNRYNLDIFDKFAQSVLMDGMKKLALTLAEGITDWEYHYIVRPDNEYFMEFPEAPYLNRAILLAKVLKEVLGDLFTEELPEEKPEEVLIPEYTSIDLAGWCKLLRFRFLGERGRDTFLLAEDKNLISPFMNFAASVQFLRNETSHENEVVIKKYQNERNAKKVFADLIKHMESAIPCVERYLRNGENAASVLRDMIEQVEEYSEMFNLSVNRMPIQKSDTGTFTAEYLYGFDRVYLAYPDCLNKDYSRFVSGELNPLMIRGHSNLAVDEGTIEYLADLSVSIDKRQAAEAKNLNKAFNNDFKNSLTMIRINKPEEGTAFLHYTEAFIQQLMKSDETICVITDDLYLSRQIEKMPENIVCAAVVDATHVAVFHPDLVADKKQMIADNRKAVVLPGKQSVVYYGDPADGVQYVLKDRIGTGGEGIIYKTDIGRECFKIYHENKLNDERRKKIEKMLSFPTLMRERRICWPIKAVYESSSNHMLVGYSMQNVHAVSETEALPLEEVILALQTGDEIGWRWNRLNLVRIAMDIVELLMLIHKNDILIGDINPKNILVNQKGRVFFIDTDSYQLEEYLCPVGIPEFASPRLWKRDCTYAEVRRTEEDERFALAGLLYYILFLGSAPYQMKQGDAISMQSLKNKIIGKEFVFVPESIPENTDDFSRDDYIWWNLTEQLREDFLKTFWSEDGEDHPEKYPSERQWMNDLYTMEERMNEGVISNELIPSDVVLSKDESWSEKICSRCGAYFRTAHNKDERLCAKCRAEKQYNETVILKVRCAECGKIFTTNPWELIEEEKITDTNQIRCPDCSKKEPFDQMTKADLKTLMIKIADNYYSASEGKNI